MKLSDSDFLIMLFKCFIHLLKFLFMWVIWVVADGCWWQLKLISAKMVATVDTDDVILTQPLFCLLLSEDILLDLTQNRSSLHCYFVSFDIFFSPIRLWIGYDNFCARTLPYIHTLVYPILLHRSQFNKLNTYKKG